MVLRSDQELFSRLFPGLFRGVSRGMVTGTNHKQICARVGPTGLEFERDPFCILYPRIEYADGFQTVFRARQQRRREIAVSSRDQRISRISSELRLCLI